MPRQDYSVVSSDENEARETKQTLLQVPLAQSKSLTKIGDRYIQLQSDVNIKEDMALNPKFEQFLGSPTDLIIHSSRIQVTKKSSGLEREASPKLFTPEKND